jgi:FemAB-related protein (PEP-CTERM system-associated)
MQVIVASEKDSDRWQSFVEQNQICFNYHRWNWKHVIEKVFKWRSFYLMAEKNSSVQGILPLFWHTSSLFGSVLCSVPFFSQAGLVSRTEEARDALLSEATSIACDVKADYLELRHRENPLPGMHCKKNKVMLVCDVYGDAERNMQQLVTRMRTNVRRSLKSGLTAEFGGKELLDDFYRMFSLRMRELGTPVYSRQFFETICEYFPAQTFVCRILHRGKTIGGAFLTGYRDLMEANWSASDPGALDLRPNMFLFWNLLCFAGERGYSTFDFGRSSVGSGTYNFKLQWGARPIQLYWNYWTPSGEKALELNPENPKYRAATWLWKRMPLALTQLFGPPIARSLP